VQGGGEREMRVHNQVAASHTRWTDCQTHYAIQQELQAMQQQATTELASTKAVLAKSEEARVRAEVGCGRVDVPFSPACVPAPLKAGAAQILNEIRALTCNPNQTVTNDDRPPTKPTKPTHHPLPPQNKTGPPPRDRRPPGPAHGGARGAVGRAVQGGGAGGGRGGAGAAGARVWGPRARRLRGGLTGSVLDWLRSPAHFHQHINACVTNP
jgi:hypothetical protein